MNRIEETVSIPSMSDRASVTRAQVARIGEANVEQMTTQLDHWGLHLDALVARVIASGAGASADLHQALGTLKAKHELARARFEEFKTAGTGQWRLFRSGIERSWTDFEAALEKVTGSLSSSATNCVAGTSR
jgi:hypothetical protein